MNRMRVLTGGLLLVLGGLLALGTVGLFMAFGYPGVLAEPTGDILTRFAAGGIVLRLIWYAQFVAALVFIPAAVGVALVGWDGRRTTALLAGVFGVVAGLALALGTLHWTVLVPQLAESYIAPGASELDRALAVSAFESARAYFGTGVGQLVAFPMAALFALAVAWPYRRRLPALAWSGAAVAVALVLAKLLALLAVPGAAVVGALALLIWAGWAALVGLGLMRGARRLGFGPKSVSAKSASAKSASAKTAAKIASTKAARSRKRAGPELKVETAKVKKPKAAAGARRRRPGSTQP